MDVRSGFSPKCSRRIRNISSIEIDALMVHWPHGWMFDWQGGGWEYIAFLTAALLSICRARRWPVFAGHPHSARIRSISPPDTGKGRTTLGRRIKDTLEYDREINAQSAVGCDS